MLKKYFSTLFGIYVGLANGVETPASIGQPVLKYCPDISYPIGAINKGIGGLVVLRGTVGVDGILKDMRVVFSNADGSLVKTATDTFPWCNYSPAIENGKSRESVVIKSYRWVINETEVRIHSRDQVVRPNCTKLDYPSASKRLGEEGTVGLKFLVSENSEILQAVIDVSSGFLRLDEAAILGLVTCKFSVPAENGVATSVWSTMKYTWKLNSINTQNCFRAAFFMP